MIIWVSHMDCFLETKSLVQLLNVLCETSSPTDKRNKNETGKVSLTKLLKHLLCIFSQVSIIIEIEAT